MGALGLGVAIALSLAVGLVGRWLAAEIGVWHRPLCNFLVRKAAARLPLQEQREYEAEWLAMIADVRSPTGQLVQSLSLILKAGHVRDEIEMATTVVPPRDVLTKVLHTVLAIAIALLLACATIAVLLSLYAASPMLKFAWAIVAALCVAGMIGLILAASALFFGVDVDALAGKFKGNLEKE